MGNPVPRSAWLAVALLLNAAIPPEAARAETLLIRNVVVVDPAATDPARNAEVLVGEGRIVAIGGRVLVQGGQFAAPDGAEGVAGREVRVIEGEGRYLIPGLAEMHAHVPPPEGERAVAEDLLKLYVANGVTTIRGMLGAPWHLKLREQLATGEVLGPRLFAGAPSLNGNSAPDPQTAARLVREYEAAGYDFLKLHPGLRREVFDAIVATAREVGIPFAGHVSAAVGIEHALLVRQSAVDHLDGYLDALAGPACREGRAAGFFAVGFAECADTARIPALVALTLQAGTWNVPTQSLLEKFADPPASVEALRRRPEMKYLSPATAQNWMKGRRNFLGAQALTPAVAERFIDLRRRVLRSLHEGGAGLLIGADSPQVFNVPGFATHDELAAFVRAGIPARAALLAATANPARLFGRAGEFGSIVPGQAADLVLLEANPLEDIANTRRIAGVMLRGKWFSRAELDELLAGVAARAAQ